MTNTGRERGTVRSVYGKPTEVVECQSYVITNDAKSVAAFDDTEFCVPKFATQYSAAFDDTEYCVANFSTQNSDLPNKKPVPCNTGRVQILDDPIDLELDR